VTAKRKSKPAILMMAYTHYNTDPRVIREAEAAVHAGYEVDVLVLRRENEPEVECDRGVNVIHLNQRRYRGGGHFQYLCAYLEFFLRCAFKSAQLHLKKRYRVIHVNNMPDILVFSTLFAKAFGAKVILDIHDPMPDTFAWKFRGGHKGFLYRAMLFQERISAWYADAVVTVSDPVKFGILVEHGIAAESIHVVANFADDELFALRDKRPGNGPIKMVFHGTILERYGLRDLVLALAQVKRQEGLQVRIIGEGDFSSELKRLIEELKLGGFVTFENRLYPLVQIPDIIAQYDVGLAPLKLSPSTNYGLPSKVIEYLALGMPVVTIPNTAISYYLKDGDCLFYEPGNIEALATILNRIVDNPDTLKPYQARAREIRPRFLWSHERAKYVKLLSDLSHVEQASNSEVLSEPAVPELQKLN
jgi:glycosyltransferase involved in cell wall biosynthesis